LLGWRAFTAEAIEALGQSVTYVVAPCDVDTAVRHGLGERIIVVPDPTNVEHVLAGLERHDVDLKSFTAVGTNLEHALVAAAVVGDMSRAKSLPPRTAVLLRDKVAQKHAVRGAGLPVADCFTVETLLDLPVSDSAYPLVVKPLAGAGTTDTFVLASAQEAVSLQASRPGREGHGPWAVEEFVDGAELQIDGVIRDGRLLALAVSRYLQNLITIKTGGLVGTVLLEPSGHADLYAQAQDLVSRALAALGHTNGVFHLEAFRQGDRLVFSECAGRTSGGMVREKLQEK
jgi:biotin carboxylase